METGLIIQLNFQRNIVVLQRYPFADNEDKLSYNGIYLANLGGMPRNRRMLTLYNDDEPDTTRPCCVTLERRCMRRHLARPTT